MTFFEKKSLPKGSKTRKPRTVRKYQKKQDVTSIGRAREIVRKFIDAGIVPDIPSARTPAYRDQKDLQALDLQFGKEKVTVTVDQFCKVWKNEYSPKVWSIQSFCLKYKQIRNFLVNHREYQGTSRISKEAKTIKDYLALFHLENVESILARSVQTSMDNYALMITIVKQTLHKNRFSKYLLNQCWGPGSQNRFFIAIWYDHIFEGTKILENPRPQYRQLTFSPLSPRFKRDLIYYWIDGADEKEINKFYRELTVEYKKRKGL